MLRKWCDKSLAICVDQYLCPIFGDNTADINIEHLASIKSCFPIFAGRQSGSINCQHFNLIGIINLPQRGAYTPGLSTCLSLVFSAAFLARTVLVRRGWFTAVATVKV